MKQHPKLQHWFQAASLALALSCSNGLAQMATNDYVINTFDTSAEGNWFRFWGYANMTMAFDATKDSHGSAGSGSLMCTINFDGSDSQFAYGGTYQQGSTWMGAHVLNAGQYTNLVFDLWWDTNNPASSFNNLDIGLVTDGYGQTWLPTLATIQNTNGWQHVVAPINPALPDLNHMGGIVLKKWDPALRGLVTFWVDNIKLEAPTTSVTIPPPTMSLQSTTPGLQLISTSFGGANSRYSIHTANPAGWMNSPTSTTYSVKIKSYPKPYSSYANFQTHIFLVPASTIPYGLGDNSVDWNSTNLIFVQIADNGAGGGYSRFMYKTNVDGGPGNGDRWEGQIFGSNTLATLGSSTILGTWKLTFNNNTNVTFTSPDNSSTNFVLPAPSAAYFNDPNGLYAYFGMQPNGSGNVGQSSVLGELSVTGAVDGNGNPVADIDDTFTVAPLDLNTWALASSDNNGVQVVTTDTPFWLIWTLPDTDFNLEHSDELVPGSWTNPGLSPIQLGPVKRVLVPASLSSANSSFFRLHKVVP